MLHFAQYSDGVPSGLRMTFDLQREHIPPCAAFLQIQHSAQSWSLYCAMRPLVLLTSLPQTAFHNPCTLRRPPCSLGGMCLRLYSTTCSGKQQLSSHLAMMSMNNSSSLRVGMVPVLKALKHLPMRSSNSSSLTQAPDTGISRA